MVEEKPDVLSEMKNELLTGIDKMHYLQSFNECSTSFREVVDTLFEIYSNEVILEASFSTRLEGAQRILRLLRIQQVFETPVERRAVAAEIISLFEAVVQSKLCALLALALAREESPEILTHLTLCVAFIAPGPRVASVPSDSLLHPAQLLFKNLLVASNVVAPLVQIVRAVDPQEDSVHAGDEVEAQRLRQDALLALASIALCAPVHRDFVVNTLTTRARRESLTSSLNSSLGADNALAGSAERGVFAPSFYNEPQHFSFDANADFLNQLRRLEFTRLAQESNLNFDELNALLEYWQKPAEAKVTREEFAEGLRRVGVTDELAIEQNFRAFDVDRNGWIDFREFCSAVGVIKRGSREQRLRLVFRSYDLDGSGFLSPAEVFGIFRTATLFKGGDEAAQMDQEVTKEQKFFVFIIIYIFLAHLGIGSRSFQYIRCGWRRPLIVRRILPWR